MLAEVLSGSGLGVLAQLSDKTSPGICIIFFVLKHFNPNLLLHIITQATSKPWLDLTSFETLFLPTR
jgi:hypothetical protein